MTTTAFKTERMMVLKRVVVLMCDIRPSEPATFLSDVMHRIERSFIRNELSLKRIRRSSETRLLIRRALNANPNFINFTDDQKEAAIDITIPITYTVGAFIGCNDLFENLYIIEKGEVEIYQGNKFIKTCKVGDCFGSLNCNPYYMRDNLVRITKFTKVWHMTQTNWHHLAIDHTAWKRIMYTDSLIVDANNSNPKNSCEIAINPAFAPSAPSFSTSRGSSCDSVIPHGKVIPKVRIEAGANPKKDESKIPLSPTLMAMSAESNKVIEQPGTAIGSTALLAAATESSSKIMRNKGATDNIRRENKRILSAVSEPSIPATFDVTSIVRPVPLNLFGDNNRIPTPPLLQSLSVATFPKGAIVMHQGQANRDFYYILEGEAVIYIKDDDEELREICRLGPKNHFGDNGFLLNRAAPSTIKAANDLKCLQVHTQIFERNLAEWFD